MSSRALRRLREERLSAQQATVDENETSEEDEDESPRGGGGGGGFFGMIDEEDTESESSESDDEVDEDGDDDGRGTIVSKNEESVSVQAVAAVCSPSAETKGAENEDDDDIDKILSEFQATTTDAPGAAPCSSSSSAAAAGGTTGRSSSSHSILLSKIDPRDYDLDYTMRTMLGMGGDAGAPPQEQPQQLQQRRGRGRVGGGGGRPTVIVSRKCVFGKPRDDWGKPPNYVGGGLGMRIVEDGGGGGGGGDDVVAPWPYGKEEEDRGVSDAIGDAKPKASSGGGGSGGNSNKSRTNTRMKKKRSAPRSSSSGPYANAKWYTFHPSDTYTALSRQYETVSASGDVNALALFTADNPYYVPSLLQLSMVLFHTNDRERGMELLKRAIWVYECASIGGFLPSSSGSGKGGGGGGGGGEEDGTTKNVVLMDSEGEENGGWFSGLFRLMQCSCIMGCVKTSFAISRYLLSLDPLRDPMGVLLTMDYFALATRKDEHAKYVVELVESKTVQIHHREDGGGDSSASSSDPPKKHHKCDLLQMPNWSYSYALALYQLSLSPDVDDDTADIYSDRSDEALQMALRQYPSVLPLLLEKNGVDVKSRSCSVDWPPLLEYFRRREAALARSRSRIVSRRDGDEPSTTVQEEDEEKLATAARTASERIIRIFVDRNHKLWDGDDAIKWLHDACAVVAAEEESSPPNAVAAMKTTGEEEEEKEEKAAFGGEEEVGAGQSVLSPPPAALIRYSQCDPSDYADSFRTLPADANPLDPALVAPALALDPNRRRMLRRNDLQQGGRRGGGGGGEGLAAQLGGIGPGGEMVVIDPDSPLAEVFWRSLMPWNHVEGVEPPRR